MNKHLADLRSLGDSLVASEYKNAVEETNSSLIVVTPTQWAYLEQVIKPFPLTKIDCLNVNGKTILRIPKDHD